MNWIIILKADRTHQLLGYKGYSDLNRQICWAYGYQPYIRSRGDKFQIKNKDPRKRIRRWVVERTFSWFTKFRLLYFRWENKSKNYEPLLHFACAVTAFRACGISGWALN